MVINLVPSEGGERLLPRHLKRNFRSWTVKPNLLLNRKQIQLPCAVAEAFQRNPQLVQQGQIEVRHRRILWILDVAPSLDLAQSATQHHDGQLVVRMLVAI